jgi:hypothetical protein
MSSIEEIVQEENEKSSLVVNIQEIEQSKININNLFINLREKIQNLKSNGLFMVSATDEEKASYDNLLTKLVDL